MYRQGEEQTPWGQGVTQGQQQQQQQHQEPQHWQQSPIHAGQPAPQYYPQQAAPQQYGPGNPQGVQQPWGQNGRPQQQPPYQQGASMYASSSPANGQANLAWQPQQQQQGGQGWQGASQGQFMGQGAPQQAPAGMPANARTWVGAVTQLIPPNYGIVDGNAFYVEPVVEGKLPAVGDRVKCQGIPNTDGGMYEWRLLRVELVQPQAVSHLPPPNQAQPGRPFAIPHNRLPGGGKARDSPAQTSPARSPAYSASPARQPSAVPSRPLEGFKEGPQDPMKAESAAQAEPAKYNQMAPPMTAYTAEYALAKASAAMEGARQQGHAALQPERRTVFGSFSKQLDEEAQARSLAAAQQLGSIIGDPTSVGARLMGKMGFGAAGQGLGRAGQGIVAPVEAIKMGQGQGLGFTAKERNRSPDRDRPGRRRGTREDRPRQRSPPRRRPRSASRSRSRSPDSRGRYHVEPPKFPPSERERGVAALSKRYRNLYIPGDFCHVSADWVDSLPDWDPLPLTHHVGMKITQAEKETKDRASSEAPEDSTDAPTEEPAPSTPTGRATPNAEAPSRRWGARIVLMSGVNARLLHNSSAKLFQHPLKKLQFLVGQKGRKELMLIGGAWDPVDGPSPTDSPHSLIATATRTFKAATGIDLSACLHWIKFASLRYLRKNGTEDNIEENVVVYLVDAHELAVPDQNAKEVLAKAASAATTEIEAKKALDAAEEEEKSAEANFQLLGSQDIPPPPDMGDNLTINPGEMTVAALQEALSKRGLDTKWNPLKSKKELVDRLQDYVDKKRKEHAALDKDYKAHAEAKAALEAAKEGTARAAEAVKGARAAVREALKTVGDPPAVEMVQMQPNEAFLGEKESFKVDITNLDTLLAYTEKDDKEVMFEVSIFAELFQEMLEARFGQGILRVLEALERQDRLARAKKAEERRAKKEAEAAAKAKAKASAKSGADNGAKGADADVAPEETTKGVGAPADEAKGGDAMQTDAAPAGAIAPVTENGDIVMAEAKEVKAVVTAEEGAVKEEAMADANHAGTSPEAEPEPAASSAPAAAPGKVTVKPEEAPAKMRGQPGRCLSSVNRSSRLLSLKAAGTVVEEAEAKVKAAAKEAEMESTASAAKTGKDAKKDSKSTKEQKVPAKSKAKDQKARGKDKEKEKEREKAKGESKDESRSSRVDKGRSSKEDPPSKRARSDRDSSSKHRDDSSKKGDRKVAEAGCSTRDSDRAKAEDSKKGVDMDAASTEKASKKRAHSEERQADAKKSKIERQPDIAEPPAGANDVPAGESSMAEAAAAEKPMVPEAAAEAAAQPTAFATAALPPPVPRWPAQATPFLLACRYFDRDMAGYIEAGDLEEILVMVSDSVSRRRLQNLVDAVVKRSKLSYAEAHASLEVPIVPPPAAAPQSSACAPPSGVAANRGISSEQTSQQAMNIDLGMLQRRLAALVRSEAELRSAISTLEADKLALGKEKGTLERQRDVLEKEKVSLAEQLSAAQKDAEDLRSSTAARGGQAAANLTRTLEDIAAAEKGLAAMREKLSELVAELQGLPVPAPS